jgi:hypothetical protein
MINDEIKSKTLLCPERPEILRFYFFINEDLTVDQ